MGDRINERPTFEEISLELERINSNEKKRMAIRKIFGFSIVVAAISILLSLTLLPIFKIKGDSMNPSIESGDVVVVLKFTDIDRGDVVAFNHNNTILIKRVIAVEGDVVNIDEEGNVYINEESIEEPYIDK